MTDTHLLPMPLEEVAGVRWTQTYVEIVDASITFDVFSRCIAAAGATGDAAKWWLGDLLLFGEARFGEEYAQAIEAARLSDHQVTDYRYVCERVRPSRRRENLPFSYHREVAPLDPADQDRLLGSAEAQAWNREALREAVRDLRAVERVRRTPARQEVLGPVESVDTAQRLSTVRQALATVAEKVSPEGQEAIGIPAAVRALEDIGKTVRHAVAVLARPSLSDAWKLVEAVAVRQQHLADPAYIVPGKVFDDFAAFVAEHYDKEGRP